MLLCVVIVTAELRRDPLLQPRDLAMLRSALTPLYYLLLLLPAQCLSQSTSIPFLQPANCSTSQFYNVAKYSCIACDQGIQASDGKLWGRGSIRNLMSVGGVRYPNVSACVPLHRNECKRSAKLCVRLSIDRSWDTHADRYPKTYPNPKRF